jgi:methionine-rich copper-binding protein CopC
MTRLPARRFARFRPLWAAAMVVASGLLVVSPAGAHTALLQSSPGSGQVAGGVIDFLDLVYLEPVSEVEITVTGPDREVVPGEMVVDEGQIIRYAMEPLTEPGRYIVRYTMISFDEDITNSGYFFEYDPEALAPVRLAESDIPPTPLFTVQRVSIAVLAGSIIGLCGLQIVSLRRKQRLLAARRAGAVPADEQLTGS